LRTSSYSDFRQHLKERLDDVHESRAPLLVVRQNSSNAVVLDEEEYEGLIETLHLLRSPRNARRLYRAMAELDAGRGTEFDPRSE
jgi:antitoxin YefM